MENMKGLNWEDKVPEIHVVIASDTTVKFKYFHYNIQKEREYTHDGKPYEVSPWTLIYDNSNYYLLAFVNDGIVIRSYLICMQS